MGHKNERCLWNIFLKVHSRKVQHIGGSCLGGPFGHSLILDFLAPNKVGLVGSVPVRLAKKIVIA